MSIFEPDIQKKCFEEATKPTGCFWARNCTFSLKIKFEQHITNLKNISEFLYWTGPPLNFLN